MAPKTRHQPRPWAPPLRAGTAAAAEAASALAVGRRLRSRLLSPAPNLALELLPRLPSPIGPSSAARLADRRRRAPKNNGTSAKSAPKAPIVGSRWSPTSVFALRPANSGITKLVVQRAWCVLQSKKHMVSDPETFSTHRRRMCQKQAATVGHPNLTPFFCPPVSSGIPNQTRQQLNPQPWAAVAGQRWGSSRAATQECLDPHLLCCNAS